MKYLQTYKIFESDSTLRGGMDIDAYNSVREDISDILLDLTDEHYNFRTTLNGVENPTSNLVSNYFGVEICKNILIKWMTGLNIHHSHLKEPTKS